MRSGKGRDWIGDSAGRGGRPGDRAALLDRSRQRTPPPLPEKPGADCGSEEENDDGKCHSVLFRFPPARNRSEPVCGTSVRNLCRL